MRHSWSLARRAGVAAAAAIIVTAGAAGCRPSTPSGPDRPVAAPASTPTTTPAPRARAHHERPAKVKPARRPAVYPSRPPTRTPRPARRQVQKRYTRAPRTCGVPRNPYRFTLCPYGALVTAPPRGVCAYFHCADHFWQGRGYLVRCKDGSYSLTGGRRGACLWHHGEGPAVRSG